MNQEDNQNRDPHRAVDYIIANAKKFAKAKAERIYIEEYRKSLKSILMKRSLEESLGAQEREAYAHDEYKELLQGLREAVEIEEKLRWNLIAAQARVEIWRSEQANLRTEGRVTL
jgi:hypothetical protein